LTTRLAVQENLDKAVGPPAGFAAALGGSKKSWQNFKKLDVSYTEKWK